MRFFPGLLDLLAGCCDFGPVAGVGRAWPVPCGLFWLSRCGPVPVLPAGFALALGRWRSVPGASNNFGRLVSCVRLLFGVVLSAGIPSPLVFAGISGHIDKHES
jgi:hypothetical protein